MSGNRIRRYESLWTAPAEQVLGQPNLGQQGLGNSSLGESSPSNSPIPTDVPPGFAIFPLAHLTPAERQTVDAQRALYQQAYDLAKKAADEKFIRDWMI